MPARSRHQQEEAKREDAKVLRVGIASCNGVHKEVILALANGHGILGKVLAIVLDQLLERLREGAEDDVEMVCRVGVALGGYAGENA